MHRLQLSRNLQDSPGFVGPVPDPGRPGYCHGCWLGSIAHYDYSHANVAEVIGLGSVHSVQVQTVCGYLKPPLVVASLS